MTALTSSRDAVDFRTIPFRCRHRLYIAIRSGQAPLIPQTEPCSNSPLDVQYTLVLHDQRFEQSRIQLQYFSPHTYYTSLRRQYYYSGGRFSMGQAVLEDTGDCSHTLDNWGDHCSLVGPAIEGVCYALICAVFG